MNKVGTIIDMYNKKIKYINEDVSNPLDFINNNINNQEKDIIYLYSFPSNTDFLFKLLP